MGGGICYAMLFKTSETAEGLKISKEPDQTGFATNSAGKGNCPIAPLGSADPEL